MAWVKIDDHFDEHPKIAAAGPLAMAMQIAALCYCNRHLTDGFIPGSVARRLIDLEDLDFPWQTVVGKLVEQRLWEECEGGYRIHDYLKFQPSREDVLSERESAKNRMANARSKNKQGSSDEVRPNKQRRSPSPVPVPVPDPEREKDIPPSADGSPAAPVAALVPVIVGQEAQALATAAYDALKAADRRPSEQGWVGRAIGRIKQLTPDARTDFPAMIAWAALPSTPSYVGAWISKCQFGQAMDAYRDRELRPAQARASPRFDALSAIREVDTGGNVFGQAAGQDAVDVPWQRVPDAQPAAGGC